MEGRSARQVPSEIEIIILRQVIRAGMTTQRNKRGPSAGHPTSMRQILSTSAAGPVLGPHDARVLDAWSLALRSSSTMQSPVIRFSIKD